jgi:hypothetical protein
MLVVHLDAGWDAAAIVYHANGVIRVDSDQNVIAMAGKGFVNRVVYDLKN